MKGKRDNVKLNIVGGDETNHTTCRCIVYFIFQETKAKDKSVELITDMAVMKKIAPLFFKK